MVVGEAGGAADGGDERARRHRTEEGGEAARQGRSDLAHHPSPMQPLAGRAAGPDVGDGRLGGGEHGRGVEALSRVAARIVQRRLVVEVDEPLFFARRNGHKALAVGAAPYCVAVFRYSGIQIGYCTEYGYHGAYQMPVTVTVLCTGSAATPCSLRAASS